MFSYIKQITADEEILTNKGNKEYIQRIIFLQVYLFFWNIEFAYN